MRHSTESTPYLNPREASRSWSYSSSLLWWRRSSSGLRISWSWLSASALKLKRAKTCSFCSVFCIENTSQSVLARIFVFIIVWSIIQACSSLQRRFLMQSVFIEISCTQVRVCLSIKQAPLLGAHLAFGLVVLRLLGEGQRDTQLLKNSTAWIVLCGAFPIT